MAEEKAIVKHEHQVSIIRTMDDAERAAKAMATSGFFADSKQAAQAVVKILAGQELGFGPFASMTGVHIIQNKPVLAANLMAAAVKRQGKYNYRVAYLGDDGCKLDFYENGELVGRSEFMKADADKAGLTGKDNWKKFPRNMYFARALSNGQKWYAPDVFNGATVYTPDELGAPVDDEGNAIVDPAASEGGNPDPIDDKTWTAWLALAQRADKLNVPYPVVDRDAHTRTELIELGKEIRTHVEQAAAQAKADEPTA